jgi:hypothetical protein
VKPLHNGAPLLCPVFVSRKRVCPGELECCARCTVYSSAIYSAICTVNVPESGKPSDSQIARRAGRGVTYKTASPPQTHSPSPEHPRCLVVRKPGVAHPISPAARPFLGSGFPRSRHVRTITLGRGYPRDLLICGRRLFCFFAGRGSGRGGL